MSPKYLKRFLLNVAAQVVHDRHNLKEECNSDDVKQCKLSDTVPEGYIHCQHCMTELLVGPMFRPEAMLVLKEGETDG